jgi:hypothetical protein
MTWEFAFFGYVRQLPCHLQFLYIKMEPRQLLETKPGVVNPGLTLEVFKRTLPEDDSLILS